MTQPNRIEQGETFVFDAGLSGSGVSGFDVEVNVLRYPGATPAITKSLEYLDGEFRGILTSAETAALAVGQWFIHIKATDSDEDIRDPIKLYISKGWL